MIYFVRSGFRSFASLVSVLLLLLVIWLLLLDPPDRRPFVERMVLKTVDLVESVCGWTRLAVESDADAVEAPDREDKTDSGEPGNDRFTNASRPGLPADFQAALENAAHASAFGYYREHFDRVVSENDPSIKPRLAVGLARELPREWWPVNGERVHQLDLPLLLRIDDLTAVPQQHHHTGSGQIQSNSTNYGK